MGLLDFIPYSFKDPDGNTVTTDLSWADWLRGRADAVKKEDEQQQIVEDYFKDTEKTFFQTHGGALILAAIVFFIIIKFFK